ncbi:superoxide dismutase family protein [Aquisalinus luteolus]|nr:superoxide dismutase family protein [Aquisalinus luteolus]
MYRSITAAIAASIIAAGSVACADQTVEDQTVEENREVDAASDSTMTAEQARRANMGETEMTDEGPAEAQAVLMDPEGNEVGTVSFTQTPNGVLIRAGLTNVPAGEHGFHIHETGACSPDFGAAGGHYAPRGNDHGALSENGLHAGDMPNIFVSEDGTLVTEVLNTNISLLADETGTLFDEDGSAVMIHSGPDDYQSQPSGAAGDRIACGVVERM